DPGTGVRTVTQTLQVSRGTDTDSLTERRKLFQNAVWWLLNRGCEDADLYVEISASADQVKVGDKITYTITMTQTGECPGTGVRLYDPLPPEVTFVSADSPRGTWAYHDGVVTFNLGFTALSQILDVTVVVTATKPGIATNSATVRNVGPEVTLANNVTDPP